MISDDGTPKKVGARWIVLDLLPFWADRVVNVNCQCWTFWPSWCRSSSMRRSGGHKSLQPLDLAKLLNGVRHLVGRIEIERAGSFKIEASSNR